MPRPETASVISDRRRRRPAYLRDQILLAGTALVTGPFWVSSPTR
jgi:hypothetical protein